MMYLAHNFCFHVYNYGVRTRAARSEWAGQRGLPNPGECNNGSAGKDVFCGRVGRFRLQKMVAYCMCMTWPTASVLCS